MPPGSQWKSSVNEVKNKTDRLSKQIDKLAEVDNRFKKTMFANPNTKVTLEVKTRKPDTNNWSSMLSDNTADEHHAPPQRKVSHNLKKKTLTKKPALSSKHSKTSTTAKKTPMPSRDEPDVKLGSQVAVASQHRFSERTLQIFLKEMRLALKDDNHNELYKIIDDLEYVAANLNGSAPGNRVNPEHLLDIAFYKTTAQKSNENAKKAKDDCKVLERNVYKLEKKVEILEETDKSKDLKIKELKSVITRLSNNSNDMLGTLQAKADIDDKLKNLEKKLNLTQQQLSAEKFKNSQLDLKSKSANLEINKLRKSIEAMKVVGMQRIEKLIDNDLMQIETGPNESTTTVDLSISMDRSEKSVSLKSGVSSPDPDSALGSALNSQALASGPDVREMSFKPLGMSETKSSQGSNWSEVLQEEEENFKSKHPTNPDSAVQLSTHSVTNNSTINLSTPGNSTEKEGTLSQETQPGLDAKNIEDIGQKVAEALKKFRNDDKFQVSLSSEFQTKNGGNFQTDETRNFSLGTDLDGTDNLTESRFIQGLENSLENLLTTNNDDEEN